jgi:predicted MFS family arabinose efflux permease
MAVPPLMPILIDRFKIHLSEAGLMMSMIGFIGLLTSLPIGHLVERYGIRVMGIVGGATVFLGCLMGAWAPNYITFLVSRAFIGIGFNLLMLLGVTAVGLWFTKERRGLGMGLMSTCPGISSFLAMATASRIQHSYGLNAVWQLCAASTLLLTVAIAIGVRMPPWMSAAKMAGQKKIGFREAFANRNMWLLGVVFFGVFFATMALTTFYITYLTSVRGFSLQKAGMLNSIGWLGLMAASVLSGYLVDKIGHLQLSLTIGILVLAVLALLPFHITGIMIPIWVILLYSTGMGFCKIVCMTAIPGIMVKPQLIGVGMSIYGFTMSVGGMLGPASFGTMVQHFGWNIAGYALVPILLIGVIAVRMTRFAK